MPKINEWGDQVFSSSIKARKRYYMQRSTCCLVICFIRTLIDHHTNLVKILALQKRLLRNSTISEALAKLAIPCMIANRLSRSAPIYLRLRVTMKQVTNELVRQLLEQGGLYSLDKPIGDIRTIVDTRCDAYSSPSRRARNASAPIYNASRICQNFAIACSFVAAMNVPGGGKNDIPNRLKRHFAIFYVPPPSTTAVTTMFHALIQVEICPPD